MKTVYGFLLSFAWLLCCPDAAYAQRKQNNGNHDPRACGETCFSTQVISATRNDTGCTDYVLKVSYTGRCQHALSHFTVGIGCGTVTGLSNSQNWKQEYGKDPTTGLYGFKIDDIPEFGETRLDSFLVNYTLCPPANCDSTCECMQQVVAYKAGQCVNYDTLNQDGIGTPPEPQVCNLLNGIITRTDISCFQASDGTATAIVNGTPPYSYLWSTSATTATVSGLPAGDYSVLISDATGESITLETTINEPDAIAISGTVADASCNGTNDGSIDLTVTGGRGTLTYLWSNGASTQDINSVTARPYSVTVTDSAGCTSTASFNVKSISNIIISAAATRPACSQANGALDITVQGGSTPYSFQWSNDSTSEDITGLSAGIYSLTVTDASGCSAQVGYNLKEDNTLQLAAQVTPAGCLGEPSGAIDLTVAGGLGPYTYQWSNGETTEDIDSLATGIYDVTVTDANGCTASLRINVPRITLQFDTQIMQPLCAGDNTGSIIVEAGGGVPPYDYSWASGETLNQLSNLSAGKYTLTVTDGTGCSRTAAFILSDPAVLEASVENGSNACGGEGTMYVDLNVEGGIAPYSYVWSNGEVTEDLDSLNSGSYSVTITDGNGCTLTTDVTVEAPGPQWSCLIDPPVAAPDCSSTGNLLRTSIHSADAYLWRVVSDDCSWAITSGDASDEITYTAGSDSSSATFTLTIYNAGCTQSCSYTISACQQGTAFSEVAATENTGDPGPTNSTTTGTAALSISAYPNPFLGEVTFQWTAPANGYGRLDIYDLAGSHVASLFEGTMNENETYQRQWAGSGSTFYYYRLSTTSGTVSGKLFKTR